MFSRRSWYEFKYVHGNPNGASCRKSTKTKAFPIFAIILQRNKSYTLPKTWASSVGPYCNAVSGLWWKNMFCTIYIFTNTRKAVLKNKICGTDLHKILLFLRTTRTIMCKNVRSNRISSLRISPLSLHCKTSDTTWLLQANENKLRFCPHWLPLSFSLCGGHVRLNKGAAVLQIAHSVI